jgi:hypothetical protein
MNYWKIRRNIAKKEGVNCFSSLVFEGIQSNVKNAKARGK